MLRSKLYIHICTEPCFSSTQALAFAVSLFDILTRKAPKTFEKMLEKTRLRGLGDDIDASGVARSTRDLEGVIDVLQQAGAVTQRVEAL